MSKLRRFPKLSDIYFITCVTRNRERILCDHYSLLVKAFLNVRGKADFGLIAWVVVPDHIHCLMEIKEGAVSSIVQKLKMSFGALYRGKMGIKSGRIWQKRFWDHIIRNQEDFNRHLDYIHYNPVKHGLGKNPFVWPFSSIKRYHELYPPDWCVSEQTSFEDDFGE